MEQMRLFAPPVGEDAFIEHLIYQPDNTPDMKPWAVSLIGWSEGKMTVKIHHESLQGGTATFPDIRLPTAQRFSRFVAKMIDVYISCLSKPYIELRPIDLLALEDGYREGVRNAKRYRIGK